MEEGQPAALVAQALYRPPFRAWLESQRRVEAALKLRPDNPELRGRLGRILAETGRWRAAATESERVARAAPLVPGNQASLVWALWHAGDLDQAGSVLARARKLWPTNAQLWLLDFQIRLLSLRADEALEMAEHFPFGLGGTSPLPVEAAKLTARALVRTTSDAIDAAERAILGARRDGEIASFIAIPLLCAMNRNEPAWELATDYFLGRKNPSTGTRLPLSRFQWRRTDILFIGATRSMRNDARFPALATALGLTRYWNNTNTKPDAMAG